MNNEAKASNRKISEVYNSDVVIEFLKQNLIIEGIKDEQGNWQEGIYLINLEKLQEDGEKLQQVGKFQLEKSEEKYMIVWYDEKGDSENVGELQIQQTT